MPKRGFDLTVQMRKDLFDAYRKVYGSCHSQEEAWEKTIKQPAPRFYVSPKRAYHVLINMVKGDFGQVDSLPALKRKMYYDIFENVNRMSQKTEFIGKSLWFICQFAVSMPAPEFYISTQVVSTIINRGRRFGLYYHYEEVYGKSRR